jgi:hypothetical protein
MYYSEPEAFPNHFIGHHIHEKALRPRDKIKQMQNSEIRIAKGYYEQGKRNSWGIVAQSTNKSHKL